VSAPSDVAERRRLQEEALAAALGALKGAGAAVVLFTVWDNETLSPSVGLVITGDREKQIHVTGTVLNNLTTWATAWVGHMLKKVGYTPPEPKRHTVLGGRSRYGHGRQRR